MQKKKKAQSLMEFMALLVFLLSALFIFQNYIKRAFYGSWKKAGDTFAHGQQYDPRGFGARGEGEGTFECFFAAQYCVAPLPAPPCASGPFLPPCPVPYAGVDISSTCPKMNLWISTNCVETFCNCDIPKEDRIRYIEECLICLAGTCSENTGAGEFCQGS